MLAEECYFTADLHFSHKGVLQFCADARPYRDVDEMNASIIKTWNETVPKTAHVYLLGDVSFTNKIKTRALVRQLNGQIHLVKGNHDSKPLKQCDDLFASVSDYKEITVSDPEVERGKRKICMMHFPILSWNRMHYGSWMLHGHCHGGLRESLPEFWGPKRLDVGWDVWRKPVSYNELKEVMEFRQFTVIDNHRPKQ